MSKTPNTADTRDLEHRLDSLQLSPAAAPSRAANWWAGVWPPTVAVLLLLLIWQTYCWIAQPRPDLYPSVIDVAAAIGANWDSGRLPAALLTSLTRGALGFVYAIILGTIIGFLLVEVPLLRRAFGPIISGLQVLPSVAWVPAAILWFGLTDATVYFVILMGAVPSIANGLVDGIRQVPSHIRRVGVVLGAGPIALHRFVLFPAALPGYLAGLRQGWAFAWRSLMAAEIIATGGKLGFGLGSLLQQNRELADLPGVLATVLTILALGILIEVGVFTPIQRRILLRRGLTEAR